jgi:aryl-alcohol dehydrogenase-like predicted oxidoreductase
LPVIRQKRTTDYVRFSIGECRKSKVVRINGIAFIPWFPLAAGKVPGDVLNRIAQAHHASPKQIALGWLLRRSSIMLPIPGTSSIDHLEENVAAACLRIADEEYEKLSGVPELVGSR